MKSGDKVATLLFWAVTLGIAVLSAWNMIRSETHRTNPWLLLAVAVFCLITGIGMRECLRSMKDHSSASTLATVAFWVGAVAFLVIGVIAVTTYAA